MKKLHLVVIFIIIVGLLTFSACEKPTSEKWEISYETAYANAVSLGYTGSMEEFINALKGDSGDSAYQIAVKNGFEGTETEWLNSLKGKSSYEIALDYGFQGSEGEWLIALMGQKGDKGENGNDGLSAYQIAVINGFIGSQSQWLVSLIGEQGGDGLSAYELALIGGFEGSQTDWLISLIGEQGEQGLQGLQGENGLSAYEIALAGGFSGSESAWLISLIGEQGLQGDQGIQGEQGLDGVQGLQGIQGVQGNDGLSAYEIAVANGFVGSELDWLVSLQGEKGEDGNSLYDIAAIIADNNLISSVISITATATGVGSAVSSGVIITNDGYILTNAHCVVYEFATTETEAVLFDTLTAKFKGSETVYTLQLIHYDDTKDLAIVKMISPPQNLNPVTMGDSDDLSIGDTTIVIGNAVGLGITASSGIVSETAELYSISYMNGAIVEAIRTDAAINPGNSGGGLFDKNGNLIGINTFKIASELLEGLGFGLSINFAIDYIDSVATEKAITINYIVTT